MPTAAIVAGIQSAATLGSAAMASRTADSASNRQAKAGMNALGYEMRGDKRQAQVQEREWEDYRRRHDEWVQRNFGNTPTLRGNRPRQQQPGATGAMPTNAAPQGVRPPQPQAPQPNLAALMGIPQGDAGVPALIPQGRPSTVADLGGWNDWQRYGA